MIPPGYLKVAHRNQFNYYKNMWNWSSLNICLNQNGICYSHLSFSFHSEVLGRSGRFAEASSVLSSHSELVVVSS